MAFSRNVHTICGWQQRHRRDTLDIDVCALDRENRFCKATTNYLSLSDGQVDLYGVQNSHPVGVRLPSWRLLTVHVEENGQEVLGEATQLCLFLFLNDKIGKEGH